MIEDIIKRINSVINIKRENSLEVILDIVAFMREDDKETTKISPSIFGFFQDIVVNIDWGKPHVSSNFDILFKRLDQDNPSGKHYYRLFDIFDHAIKNYLAEAKIEYAYYIRVISAAIANTSGYNLKLTNSLASADSTSLLLLDHSWLATIYILAHTDLAYIINIDLPLTLGLNSLRN